MAKSTQPRKDSKITIPNSDTITQTQSFPKPLYSRIVAFKDMLGLSSDQEAVRVLCHKALEKTGL
jgi:hypothetical protein